MKCVGMFGRIFGHKFLKSKGGRTYSSDYCYRCGRRRGDV